MDRELAIERLNKMRRVCDMEDCNINCELCEEALDLAIQALMVRDKHIKALERLIEGTKEINRFLEEAAEKSDEKLQLSGETSTIDGETSTNWGVSEDGKTSWFAPKEMTLEEWQELDREIRGDAESATTTKLKNPDDSLLTEGAEACKEQKSKLDWISRQQAIDGLCQNCEAFDCIVNGSYCGHDCTEVAILKNLPPVTPKPIDDCISRQDAIEALEHIHIPTQAQREYAWEIFDKIPPVTPTERTGEWIFNTDETNGKSWNICSICGESIFHESNYCPNCGAKMGGADMRGDKE